MPGAARLGIGRARRGVRPRPEKRVPVLSRQKRPRFPLVVRLGVGLLAVVAVLVAGVGLLARTVVTSEIRWLLEQELLPGVQEGLDRYARFSGDAVRSQRDEALRQTQAWFRLDGESTALSLAREVYHRSAGHGTGGLRALAQQRVASDPLLVGLEIHSGGEVVAVGDRSGRNARPFEARIGTGPESDRVVAYLSTDPLETAFRQLEEAAAETLARADQRRQALVAEMADRARSTTGRSARRLLQYLGTAGLTGLVLAAIGLWFIISRTVTRPLGLVAAAARAAARGDLRSEPAVHRGDELGVLADAFRQMTRNLKTILLNLRDTGGDVTGLAQTAARCADRIRGVAQFQEGAMARVREATGLLDGSIGEVEAHTDHLTQEAGNAAAAAQELSASITLVAERSEGHARIAEDAAARVSQMIRSLSDIAAHLQGLTATSEQITSTLHQIRGTVERVEHQAEASARVAADAAREATERGLPAVRAAVAGMGEIERSVGQLTEVIGRLAGRAEEIGQVVTVIEDVAGQTKLLSLNAAILAAQAGPHGRAFSVVANQIRGLAERTARATQEVAAMVGAVQAETRTTADASARGLEAVRTGRNLVGDVEQALDTIVERSERAASTSQEIREVTAEEAVAVAQIAQAVTSMNEEVDMIARATFDQDVANRAVLEQMEQIRTSAGEVVASTSAQMKGSHEIAEVSSRVAASADQIATAVRAQRGQSADIGTAVAAVTDTIQDLVDSAAEMEQTVRALETHLDGAVAELRRFRLDAEPSAPA